MRGRARTPGGLVSGLRRDLAASDIAAFAPPVRDRFLGRPISPLTRRRLDSFRHNRRGFWSLWIFLAVFFVSLFAEFIANDRPILVRFDGAWYFPVFVDYPETVFGGVLPSAAARRDGPWPGFRRSERR